MTAIRGHKLQKYVTEDKPPQYETEADRVAGKISEQFLEWEQQDQLLLSWLLSSMSESMLTRVVGCRTAKQSWVRIHDHFACHTRAKIRQLKLQLRNTKNRSMKMSECLLKIKSIVDSLIAMGYEVSTSEHVELILDGLPSDYDAFITSVSTRTDPFTVSEIEAHLLAQETRIERNHNETLSANITNVQFKNPSSGSNFNHNQTNKNQYFNNRTNSSNYQNFSSNYNANYRGRNNNHFKGRGRRGYNSNNSGRSLTVCQIYNKACHLASTCFYKYDQNQSSQNQKHSVQVAAINPSAEPSTDTNLPWFSDSGASTHVTADYSNLHSSVNYNGQNKLHMGDGTSIPIQYIGHAFIQSPFKASTKPSLFNILHVPDISKKLLSVSQFTKDNKVLFEFHPNTCIVKSQDTRQMLLQGKVREDGLYVFYKL